MVGQASLPLGPRSCMIQQQALVQDNSGGSGSMGAKVAFTASASDSDFKRLENMIEEARKALQSSSMLATPHVKALMLRLARLDDGDGMITHEEYTKISDEISSVVSSLQDYWTLLGVVAALILSMALGPCLNKVERSDLSDSNPDDPTSDLSAGTADVLLLIHILLMFSCCMLQGLAIFLCCHYYNHTTIVSVDPLDKLEFIMLNNPTVPQAMCVGGVFLMIAGAVTGMALYISVLSSAIAGCIVAVVALYLIYFHLTSSLPSYSQLPAKIEATDKVQWRRMSVTTSHQTSQ